LKDIFLVGGLGVGDPHKPSRSPLILIHVITFVGFGQSESRPIKAKSNWRAVTRNSSCTKLQQMLSTSCSLCSTGCRIVCEMVGRLRTSGIVL